MGTKTFGKLNGTFYVSAGEKRILKHGDENVSK